MKAIGLNVLLVLVCVLVGLCSAAAKPAIVSGRGEWTVDVKFEHLRQVEVHFQGERQPRRYWYIILTLHNKTGRDVEFYPQCDLMTDTFQVLPVGKSMPSVVFDCVKAQNYSTYPFLEPLEDTSNRILQGEDNVKDIVIIWPDFDTKAKGVRIFVTGLSNETAVVRHPVLKDDMGRAKKIFLRKTLELSYKIGGDPEFRSETRVRFQNKRWVMR
jgi:hypothetical protein